MVFILYGMEAYKGSSGSLLTSGILDDYIGLVTTKLPRFRLTINILHFYQSFSLTFLVIIVRPFCFRLVFLSVFFRNRLLQFF